MKRILAILITTIFALSSFGTFAFADEKGASETEPQQEINAQASQSSDDTSDPAAEKASTTDESTKESEKVYEDSFTFDYSFACQQYRNEGLEYDPGSYLLCDLCSEAPYELCRLIPENSNPAVIKIEDNNDTDPIYLLTAKKAGTTTLTYTYENATYIFTITVEQGYLDFYDENSIKISEALPYYFGESYIEGSAANAEVTVYISGKKYRTIKTKDDGDGEFNISVKGKNLKIGQTIKIVFKRGNYSKTQIIKVKSSTTAWASTLYYGSKKITIKAENLHKGDKIKVKIGKKTYTYKIKKNYKKYKSTKKIKKHLTKYGNNYTIKVYNKSGKIISSKTQKMYYAKKIKKKMTKKQVRWTVKWGAPDSSEVNDKHTWWYYDKNGDGIQDSYVHFKNGKVVGWYR